MVVPVKNVLMTVLGLGEAYYSDYSVIFLDSSTEVANTDPKCNLEAEVDFVKDAFLFQPRLLADQLPGHMDAVSKGHLKTDQHRLNSVRAPVTKARTTSAVHMNVGVAARHATVMRRGACLVHQVGKYLYEL